MAGERSLYPFERIVQFYAKLGEVSYVLVATFNL